MEQAEKAFSVEASCEIYIESPEKQRREAQEGRERYRETDRQTNERTGGQTDMHTDRQRQR